MRKFTVPAATLVEPGTESMLCSAIGVWGVTSSEYTRALAVRVAVSLVGGSKEKWGGWWIFLAWWLGSMLIWSLVDWTNCVLLHSGATIEEAREGVDVPAFVRPAKSRWASSQARPSGVVQRPWNLKVRRAWTQWAKAWLGREILALPIWLWAIWGGVTVTWRERRFWVGWDMKVHEIVGESTTNEENGEAPCGAASNGHAVMHTENGEVDRENAFFRRRKGSLERYLDIS